MLRRHEILRCWRLSKQTLHPRHEVPKGFHYSFPLACLGFLLPLSTVSCQAPCGTRFFKSNWFWTVKLLVERKSRWATHWLGLITFITHIFFILKSTQQANLFVAVLLASLWNVRCSFPTMYWVMAGAEPSTQTWTLRRLFLTQKTYILTYNFSIVQSTGKCRKFPDIVQPIYW